MYAELYTKNHFRPAKMLVGVALFVLVSVGIFMFTQDATPTRASKKLLQAHEVVNISPRQIGVFWQVDAPDSGWLLYGDSPDTLTRIALDEQDSASSKNDRMYHYALIRSVEPDTQYYYKIVSDNELIADLDGKAFESQTLPIDAPNSNLTPIYGKILQQNGTPAQAAFALVRIGNAHPLLSITGATGEWLVPIQYVVNAATQSPLSVTNDTIATIQMFDEQSRSSVRSTIAQSRPIPQAVTLGTNYSFVDSEEVLSAQTAIKENVPEKVGSFGITYPKHNAIIPGIAPLIKGTGSPGARVEVTVHATPKIVLRASVNDRGVWSAPVTVTMDPGEYSLTARSTDAAGRAVTQERVFTLIKSGERVLGESTSSPSGTLTPSPSVAVTTATPTLTSVLTPTPPLVVTATPAPPVSGISIMPYMMAGVGMFILGLGVILLL